MRRAIAAGLTGRGTRTISRAMIAFLRFLFVVPTGFIAACAAASFALLWPFIDTSGAAEGDPLFWLQAILGFGAEAAQVGSVALLPWAVFMVASELFGWRSILLHCAAGVLGGFAIMRVAYGETLPHASVQTALVVAGLSFALVYWIIAGRGAGRWRRARRAGRQPSQTVETASET